MPKRLPKSDGGGNCLLNFFKFGASMLIGSFYRCWQKKRYWKHYLALTGLLALLFFSTRVTLFFNNWRQLENTLSLFARTHQFNPFSLLMDLLGGGAFVLSLALSVAVLFFCLREYRRLNVPIAQLPAKNWVQLKKQRLNLGSDLLAEVWWFLGAGITAHLLSTGITNSFLNDFRRLASWKDAVASFYFNNHTDLWFTFVMAAIVFSILFFSESRGLRINKTSKSDTAAATKKRSQLLSD